MEPNYIAKKTAWKAFHPALVLLFFLIIPIFIIIGRIIWIKCETIEFYDNKVVYKKGLLSRKETVTTFLGVLSVSVDQTLTGRIFNYGDVVIDTVGRWDISTEDIAKPHKLKRYLETKAASKIAATFAAGPEAVNYFQ